MTLPEDQMASPTGADGASDVSPDQAGNQGTANQEPDPADVLKALLGEVPDEEPKPTPQPPAPDKSVDSRLDNLERENKSLRDQATEKSVTEEIGQTIKAIRGHHEERLADLDDDIIDGYLRLKAERDPGLLKAFTQKRSNPQAWAKIERALADDLLTKFKQPADSNVTNSRRAAMDAGRGASASQPSNEDSRPTLTNAELSKMSPWQMDKWVRENGTAR